MPLTARDLMQRDVFTVSPRMRLPDLEDALLARRVSGFPVVDEGRLVGVVSRLDVVRRLAVEKAQAETLSDYYRAHDAAGAEYDHRSFDAIATEVGLRVAHMTVADVMSKDVLSVAPGAGLAEIARALVEHGFHRLPVVENGRLVGIVTSLDLVRLIADGRLHEA